MIKIRLRTDIALEELALERMISNEKININEVFLDAIKAKELNKKEGTYVTIDFSNLLTKEFMQEDIREQVSDVLAHFFTLMDIKKDDTVLICGLGNDQVTPDALGPIVCENVIVTNHFFVLDIQHDFIRPVTSFIPGVMGQTGMESSDMLKSLVESYKPSLVIVVDALATRSINRICKSIQITDAGINPGSGVKNKRKEISKDVLNTKVLAIGIPTVCELEVIINDVLKQALMETSYDLDKIYDEYIKGQFSYMVTLKDIDDLIIDMADIVAISLNKVLHNI